jgi:hypothetical protein
MGVTTRSMLFKARTDSACLLEKLKRKLKHKGARQGILSKKNVLDWCFPSSTFVKRLSPCQEKKWGMSLLGYKTNQWTTRCGESILEDALLRLDKNPKRLDKKTQLKGENGRHLVPDFETDDALYECKARTYTTTGTAGEKILGTPWKYSECFKLYKKPLYIVCMGYQEKEAENDFCLFNTKSHVRKQLLDCFERQANIKFIKFTDLLKQLL